ncbi:MAG TPA: hypothetical protein VLV84_04050 [Candidatus Acidoferrales bacterium]|nr:hypothetical protein [Candidatus Acidoferrales bacterium]
MRYGVDFTVEPLRKRQGHKRIVKPSSTVEKSMVMDNQLPPSPEQAFMREYWRIHQRKHRAGEKAKVE